jgi:drug/metabolite transporter (DMT)-like permease
MKKILIFIILPVFLTTAGELMLKHAINMQAPMLTVQDGSLFSFINSVVQPFLDPFVLACIIAIVSGGALWVIAMSKFELSFLYPFLSINYAAIIIGSQPILGETVSLFRYLSVVFIIMGLVFISRSPYSDNQEG